MKPISVEFYRWAADPEETPLWGAEMFVIPRFGDDICVGADLEESGTVRKVEWAIGGDTDEVKVTVWIK